MQNEDETHGRSLTCAWSCRRTRSILGGDLATGGCGRRRRRSMGRRHARRRRDSPARTPAPAASSRRVQDLWTWFRTMTTLQPQPQATGEEAQGRNAVNEWQPQPPPCQAVAFVLYCTRHARRGNCRQCYARSIGQLNTDRIQVIHTCSSSIGFCIFIDVVRSGCSEHCCAQDAAAAQDTVRS